MKSIETISLAWFSRKLRHVWLGGFFVRTMYFSTVDFDALIPSFASSPTICGEPQVGFIADMVRISSWTSLGVAGRPGLPFLDSRVQCSLNRLHCHRITVSGLTNISASFQSDHARDRRLHRIRSAGRILGLLHSSEERKVDDEEPSFQPEG